MINFDKYTRPGVYTENIENGGEPSSFASTSIGAFVGITPRGQAFTPILVTSFPDFQRKFARGLLTPFMQGQFLTHAVKQYFDNAGEGSKCYVVRVVDSGAKKAEADVPQSEDVHGQTLKVVAKDVGTWGNNLHVDITEVELSDPKEFNVSIKILGDEVENFTVTEEDFMEVVNSNSYFIDFVGDAKIAKANLDLTKGAENLSNVQEEDYKKGVQAFNIIQDVNTLNLPGVTSTTMYNFIGDYCKARNMYPVYDAPITALTTDALIKEYKKIKSDIGAMYYPWVKVQDPLSKQSSLMLCPPSGMLMGIYARIDSQFGVQRAPAGYSTQLVGAIDVAKVLSDEEVGELNSNNINCIVSKPGAGIICWGARNHSVSKKYRYISTVRLQQFVTRTANQILQPYVFREIDNL